MIKLDTKEKLEQSYKPHGQDMPYLFSAGFIQKGTDSTTFTKEPPSYTIRIAQVSYESVKNMTSTAELTGVEYHKEFKTTIANGDEPKLTKK